MSVEREIRTVLEDTEWGDWPGRLRLSQRLLRAGRRIDKTTPRSDWERDFLAELLNTSDTLKPKAFEHFPDYVSWVTSALIKIRPETT